MTDSEGKSTLKIHEIKDSRKPLTTIGLACGGGPRDP
jgi:hypothetical protein